MIKAWKHRLRLHHPRFLPYFPWPNIFLGVSREELVRTMKPRCTFAEMGKDCPVARSLSYDPK